MGKVLMVIAASVMLAFLVPTETTKPAKRVYIIGDSFALLAPWYVVHLCVLPDTTVADINACVSALSQKGLKPTHIIIMAGPASKYHGVPDPEIEQQLVDLETTTRYKFPKADIYRIPLADMIQETKRNPRGVDWLHMSAAGYEALRKKHLKFLSPFMERQKGEENRSSWKEVKQ